MKWLKLLGTLSVVLGSLLAVAPALSQAPTTEQARKNKAQFAEFWQAATPTDDVSEAMEMYLHLFRSTKDGKPIWGLMGPSGFTSYMEIRLLDSKGKEIAGPEVLVLRPKDHVPNMPFQAPFNWGFEPSRAIKLRVVIPHKKQRSTKDLILQLKDAPTVKAD